MTEAAALRRSLCALAAAATLLAVVGCTQRTLRITSEPPGAVVWLNDVELGRTPVETDFTFFGEYDIRLRLDGYEPITTHRKAKAPIHEWPGLDLAAAVIPHTFTTEIDWHFDLEPASGRALEPAQAEQQLLDRAREMRTLTIGGLPALESASTNNKDGSAPKDD